MYLGLCVCVCVCVCGANLSFSSSILLIIWMCAGQNMWNLILHIHNYKEESFKVISLC